jgi:hypothetical protein
LFAENLFATKGIELVYLSIKPVDLFDCACACISNQQMALLSHEVWVSLRLWLKTQKQFYWVSLTQYAGVSLKQGSFGTSFATATISLGADAGCEAQRNEKLR